ncbi:MAG TPA: MgtC/SapB family protein [Candidatus Nanoarchaeia archaeon]|nr:MgtC/SapB family protein [Candidatus Nanoarchaeia archaeon]
MVDFTLIQPFLIALALGALIGLEREYAQYKKRGHSFAGIRTFPLISLVGAISAYLGILVSPWILVAAIFFIGVLIIIAYFALAVRDRTHVGATTEVAAFLTFFIGMLAYYRETIFAIVLTIIITLVLYARSFLHSFAKKIQKRELADTLKFAVIAFIILPFLPNQGYGPYAIFNPYLIWLMVVFISGISLCGYILLKWVGEKGIAIAGLLGGIVSSTFTTLNFAHRSRREIKFYHALALGVILANTIMFGRILVEVFVLNLKLFKSLLLPILILVMTSLLFSYFIWRKSKSIKGEIEFGSPFTLKPALKFALLFAGVLALVKVANIYFSSRGIYAVSFLSGLANVDAITLSLSQAPIPLEVAKRGILLAALSNIAVKGGMVLWFGRKEFSRLVVWSFVVLIVVGIGLMIVL